MKTNILVALNNLLKYKENKLIDFYRTNTNNRANNMGDALEFYIKDLFCSTMEVKDFNVKDREYSKYLSYLGNSNNPPDFIIRKAEAVEVKKIQNLSFGDIALNSSYPKDIIYNESTLINRGCRTCEDDIGGWTKKDMIYTIGNIIDDKLRLLWILDGSCYCADKEVYERLKNTIRDGVENINGVEFTETKELGKVKKVDPLGITDLRIRGMWSIKHPNKVFDYLIEDYDTSTEFQVYTLLLKEKYDILPQENKDELNDFINMGVLKIKEVEVKNPNNPAQFLEAILLDASL